MFSVSLVLTAGTASGADISGPISSTLAITEDSQLVGDVTCTVVGGPCIQFGASGITLKLNGFIITGRSDATTPDCRGETREAGIFTNGRRGVIITGPGVVQRFRMHGIRIAGRSTRVLVERVTASSNWGPAF